MFFVVVAWFTPLIILGEGLCALVSAWVLQHSALRLRTPDDSEEESAMRLSSQEKPPIGRLFGL